MTTVIFYKGVMGADSLMTQYEVVDEKITKEIAEFHFFDKLQFINDIAGTTHLFGCSGAVESIADFFDNYQNYKKFKPEHSFMVLDWDGKELYLYKTYEKLCGWNMILNMLSLNLFNLSDWKKRVKRLDLEYKEEDESMYVIGSGAPFVQSSYEKLTFLFNRKKEKIENHFRSEDIIKYLIKIASLNDVFTNDKIYFASFNDPEKNTSVSPQSANLSKG